MHSKLGNCMEAEYLPAADTKRLDVESVSILADSPPEFLDVC